MYMYIAGDEDGCISHEPERCVLFGGIEHEKSEKYNRMCKPLYYALIDKVVCLSTLPVSCCNKAITTAQTKQGSMGLNTLTSLICTALHTGLLKSLLQLNAGWQ